MLLAVGSCYLPGYSNFANALNNRGQIVGYYSKTSNSPPYLQDQQAYLRDPDGKITLLGTLDAAVTTVPLSINDCGTIVGYSGDKAFVYRNGHLSPLGSFQGYPLYRANSINNRGQILALYKGAREEGTVIISCGRMQDVQIPGAQGVSGFFINDHGQIAGATFIPQQDVTSVHSPGSYDFIWYNTQSQTFFSNCRITGLNNRGEICGNMGGNYFYPLIPLVFPSAPDLTPVFKTYGIPEEEGFVGGINDYGQIIGYGSSGVPGSPEIALLLTPITNAPAAP